MNMQHRKRVQNYRKKTDHHHNSHNNNNTNNTHNNNSNNSTSKQNSFHSQQPKKTIPTISSIQEYTKGIIYGSLDYPTPSYCPKIEGPHKFNEIPAFPERPVAKLNNFLLGSTYRETLEGCNFESRKFSDKDDPAVKIVTSKRQNAKIFKLGGIEIDIFKKNNILTSNNSSSKLVNKFLQNDSLSSSSTTPLKRIRDEVVDASSSVKKNKRLQELQHDTTMELSFEGKAMDKSDYVRLVDSSGVMADDSHIPDSNNNANNEQNTNYDTKHLLQNTEFSFEYKR